MTSTGGSSVCPPSICGGADSSAMAGVCAFCAACSGSSDSRVFLPCGSSWGSTGTVRYTRPIAWSPSLPWSSFMIAIDCRTTCLCSSSSIQPRSSTPPRTLGVNTDRAGAVVDRKDELPNSGFCGKTLLRAFPIFSKIFGDPLRTPRKLRRL